VPDIAANQALAREQLALIDKALALSAERQAVRGTWRARSNARAC
jgi:hypothetical protein